MSPTAVETLDDLLPIEVPVQPAATTLGRVATSEVSVDGRTEPLTSPSSPDPNRVGADAIEAERIEAARRALADVHAEIEQVADVQPAPLQSPTELVVDHDLPKAA
jgi:hypothetical protein